VDEICDKETRKNLRRCDERRENRPVGDDEEEDLIFFTI
jgi:hypothetical protein